MLNKFKPIKPIKPKHHHNYVAFFLTLSCNLSCHYCINLHNIGNRTRQIKERQFKTEDWIAASNRLILREDLPLTLQGGEPTLYKGFYEFVNEVKEDIKMDLLTNMEFDADEFISNVPVWRFHRDAPYAPIRVSYHPHQNSLEDIIEKSVKMEKAGFKVGIYGVLHPDGELRRHILDAQIKCLKSGLDFRVKEYLGIYDNKLFGSFRYEGAVCSSSERLCECRTTEIIAGPGGYVYRCHADLYKGRNPIGHILDEYFTEDSIEEFRECSLFGDCNPCDVKVKTNRFQIFGHTSVEIRNIT
ncbi:MAG: 4Fe-4S cluster-binding domain-containing protein [Nitrospira sp.]|nr:4Fe-4S cluster-binding domain-containing protein [Nitrospira sp.]